MLATMIHMMKGTPYIYQGEEIGMTNVKFEFSDYKDIELINAYNDLVPNKLSHDEMMNGIYADGRDNARTPMQWDDNAHGGFTNGEPWLKVNPNYETINVSNNLADTDSIFYYYQKLIQLRKQNEIIVFGDFKRLYTEKKDLFVFERNYQGRKLLVVLNHSDKNVEMPESLNEDSIMISNYKDISNMLRPYEAIVYDL